VTSVRAQSFVAATAFALVIGGGAHGAQAQAQVGSPRADASAKVAGAAPTSTLVDRVVVRWHAPETGGPSKPLFIFERELAFEARLESLADPDPEAGAYHDRHVRAALDRHIAETLLASLPVLPPPPSSVVAARMETARGILEQRVHGAAKLLEAAQAEGIGADEIVALYRREASASLYLDRMIAPMLEPTDLELQDLWRTGSTPFKDEPFPTIKPALVRWYVGQRLAQATEAYFQNARSRVVISVSRRPR
jgi:hypothetical protein